MRYGFSLFGISTAISLLAFPALAHAQQTLTYTYDSNYNLIHTLTTPGLGVGMVYQYDTGGLDVVTHPAAPSGNQLIYQYDPSYVPQNGGPQSSARYTTSTTYDYASGGEAITDTTGPNTTTYIYDPNSNQTGSFTSSGDVTSSAYDSNGNRIVESEPGAPGHTTTNVYDSGDNLIKTIDTPGNPEATGYDAADRIVTTTTDQGGITTTYQYDATNNYNLIGSVADPGRVSAYTYDAIGRQIDAIPDPANGRTSIYQYDPGTHAYDLESTVPGNVTAMAYDSVGNRLFVTSVPEPATFGLFGLASLYFLRRRRRAK